MKKKVSECVKKCKDDIASSNDLKNELSSILTKVEEALNQILEDEAKHKSIIIEVLEKLCAGPTPDIDFREKITKLLDLLKDVNMEDPPKKAEDFLARM